MLFHSVIWFILESSSSLCAYSWWASDASSPPPFHISHSISFSFDFVPHFFSICFILIYFSNFILFLIALFFNFFYLSDFVLILLIFFLFQIFFEFVFFFNFTSSFLLFSYLIVILCFCFIFLFGIFFFQFHRLTLNWLIIEILNWTRVFVSRLQIWYINLGLKDSLRSISMG